MYRQVTHGIRRLGGLGAVTTATLLNVSRAGANNFYVGDNWVLTIQGAPSSAISMLGGKGGGSGVWNTGWVTDPSGKFVKSGVMAQGDIGGWSETWMVSGVSAVPVAFNVTTKPESAPTQSTQTQTVNYASTLSADPYTTDWMSYLFTGNFFGIPNWWGAIGIALGAYLLLGRKK